MFNLQQRSAAGCHAIRATDEDYPQRKPGNRKPRGIFHTVHLLIGLTLCVPLVLLGLSGSVLVFQSGLDAMLAPSLYRVRVSGPERSPDEILGDAKAAVPSDYAPISLTLPSAAGDSAIVRFMAEGKRSIGPKRLEVFVDPSSLAILGVRNPDTTLLGRIKRFHANILTSNQSGRKVVGCFGIAMLALAVTGLVTWWPRPGRWLDGFIVRPGARGVSLYRGIHRTAGIWGFAVLSMVSFGGVYLAFPEGVTAAIATVLPTRNLRSLGARLRVKPMPGSIPIKIDQAARLAENAINGGHVRVIGLPAHPDQPVRVLLSRAPELDSASVITVFVDPWKHKILKVFEPKGYTMGEHIVALQHSLHSGQGMSRPFKVMIFLCGLLPSLFVFTGLNIWLRKKPKRMLNSEV